MRNNPMDTVSLLLQALSLEILFKDYNNTDLMQELQKQDTQYFERIIKNQERILNILNERRNNNAREIEENN